MEILAETGTVASLVKNSFIKLPHSGFVICITKESVYFIICFESGVQHRYIEQDAGQVAKLETKFVVNTTATTATDTP